MHTHPHGTGRFLSVAAAADTLGVTTGTIRAWLRQGRLTGIKIGGLWFVPAVALARLEDAAPHAAVLAGAGS
jgi:excisionase family DNA binding protein